MSSALQNLAFALALSAFIAGAVEAGIKNRIEFVITGLLIAGAAAFLAAAAASLVHGP